MCFYLIVLTTALYFSWYTDIMDQSDGSQGGHANVHNDKVNSSSYSKKDILKQKFDSEKDAHAFYDAYAKEMGFSIRKDRLEVDEANVPRRGNGYVQSKVEEQKNIWTVRIGKEPPEMKLELDVELLLASGMIKELKNTW